MPSADSAARSLRVRRPTLAVRAASAAWSREGVSAGVVNVGDVMFDALLRFRPMAQSSHPLQKMAVSIAPGEYYLATLHRAGNTDKPDRLAAMLDIFDSVDLPVVWPLHPRTAARMKEFGLSPGSNVAAIPPCGYLPMLSLIEGARAVLTDSGGIQKEALWSRKPCVTLRDETEWVETLEGGWNILAGADRNAVLDALGGTPTGDPPQPYGDGGAAARIVEHLTSELRG